MIKQTIFHSTWCQILYAVLSPLRQCVFTLQFCSSSTGTLGLSVTCWSVVVMCNKLLPSMPHQCVCVWLIYNNAPAALWHSWLECHILVLICNSAFSVRIPSMCHYVWSPYSNVPTTARIVLLPVRVLLLHFAQYIVNRYCAALLPIITIYLRSFRATGDPVRHKGCTKSIFAWQEKY